MYNRTRLSFHWTVPLSLAYRKIREFCKHAVSVLQRVNKYNSDRDRVRETYRETYREKYRGKNDMDTDMDNFKFFKMRLL